MKDKKMLKDSSQDNESNVLVTTTNFGAKTEGAGSQYQRKLLTYLYAKSKNLVYVDTSDDLYLQGDDTDFSEDHIKALWNNAFSFISKKNNQVLGFNLQIMDFKKVLTFFSNLSTDDRDSLLGFAAVEFRKSLSESHIHSNYEKDKFHIAAHFRAKQNTDMPPFKNFTYPWQYFNIDYDLPDNNPKYYAKLYATAINQISKKSDQKIVLHLHTMASDQDLCFFKSLIDKNIEVIIKRKVVSINALVDFIEADVFLGSHSSFSWLAILLRTGPSYLRKGFRHFVPSNTILIQEVYYKRGEVVKNLIRFFKKIFCYMFFYPKYFFSLLTSRVYF